jgi:hypothetical protein
MLDRPRRAEAIKARQADAMRFASTSPRTLPGQQWCEVKYPLARTQLSMVMRPLSFLHRPRCQLALTSLLHVAFQDQGSLTSGMLHHLLNLRHRQKVRP